MIRNILIVNDFGQVNGGAGKVAFTSACLLADAGYNVTWFCATNPVDERLYAHGINVVCTNQEDILHSKSRIGAVIQGCWNRKAYVTMKRLLTSLNVKETIVHVHCFSKALSSSVFDAAKASGVKICYTLHDYFAFCPNGGLFNYQTKKICKVKPGGKDCLLCNCDARSYGQKLFRSFRHYFIKRSFTKVRKNISIISIGELNERVSRLSLGNLTNKWFRLQNPIELNKKDKVEILENETYLFVARLSAEKGIDLFCEAITQLGLNGCVLGDGYLLNEYKAKYPSIDFAGWVSGDTKENLIRKGKCLVFPSLWYEGAPLTIVEMKSYGIPCIVPDECAASEEIVDGVSGYIFKTGNLWALKNALIKFEHTDLITMQDSLLANFDANSYSERTHLQKLIEVYNHILLDQQKD